MSRWPINLWKGITTNLVEIFFNMKEKKKDLIPVGKDELLLEVKIQEPL